MKYHELQLAEMFNCKHFSGRSLPDFLNNFQQVAQALTVIFATWINQIPLFLGQCNAPTTQPRPGLWGPTRAGPIATSARQIDCQL